MNGKPPKTLTEWIDYLHAARAIPPDSPDYGDAQEAVRFALQRIQTLNTIANRTDQAAAEQGKSIGRDPVSRAKVALGAGLMHSLGAGTGEPIAGLLDAIMGGSFGAGAGRYRQGLENIGNQAPTALPIGEMLGLAGQAAVPIGQGIEGGTQLARAATQGARGPNMLSRFLLGAAHTNVAPGATLGAIQGFSAGGQDPGNLRARLQGGAMGAGMGAAGQAVFGGLGALRVPRWVKDVHQEIRATVPKGTDPALVNEVSDAAIRAGLGRDGYNAATQDRILAAFHAGKTTAPASLPPPTMRPGETITPTPQPGETLIPLPGTTQGFAVTGTRATPPVPTQKSPLYQTSGIRDYKQPVANSYRELRKLVAAGVPEDQIKINYYTRGGKLEQRIPPKPKGIATDLSQAMLPDLGMALKNPAIPAVLRAAIEREVLRRGYQLAP